VCYGQFAEIFRITASLDRRTMLQGQIHTGTVGVVGAGRKGRAASMAGTEVCQSIVPTHRLHICHAAFTPEIARCCQIHLEWLWFRTADTSSGLHRINKQYRGHEKASDRL
jgi:hypothetical protein